MELIRKMTKDYYFKNLLLGSVLAGIIIFIWWGGDSKPIILVYLSAINALLFPFSKMLIEKVALKLTSENFWSRGIFTDTAPKSGVRALYYLFAFAIAIPCSAVYFILEMLKGSSGEG